MVFKSVLKYAVYLFVGGWMFFLGLLVGRGTAPVEFDTDRFQKRLESLVKTYNNENTQGKEIELKFYEVLDQPEKEEHLMIEVSPEKKSPLPEKRKMASAGPAEEASADKRADNADAGAGDSRVKAEDLPVKTSKKRETFKTAEQAPEKTAAKSRQQIRKDEAPDDGDKITGIYTVQIASYRDFKDAVSQMASLEKKGIQSYREKGEKDGETWYRIRSGSFASLDKAKKFRDRLKDLKIDSIIIKRSNDENL